MKRVAIVSVIYLEREWQETKACIEACGVPVYYVDRKGTGSLAEAYNRGFKQIDIPVDYVWFISNPVFDNDALPLLIKAMTKTKYAAIHPSFNSDHKHIRNDNSGKVKEAKFVEFTAPIVRTDIFKDHPLNEDMPYWGHDLDWSYKVKKRGHKLGIHHGIEMRHTYMRKMNRYVTEKRKALRREAHLSTEAALIKLYGLNWKKKLGYANDRI